MHIRVHSVGERRSERALQWAAQGKGEAPARGAGEGSQDLRQRERAARAARAKAQHHFALKHSIILQAYIYAGAAS